jgi:hypothetical protein
VLLPPVRDVVGCARPPFGANARVVHVRRGPHTFVRGAQSARLAPLTRSRSCSHPLIYWTARSRRGLSCSRSARARCRSDAMRFEQDGS